MSISNHLRVFTLVSLANMPKYLDHSHQVAIREVHLSRGICICETFGSRVDAVVKSQEYADKQIHDWRSSTVCQMSSEHSYRIIT